MTTLTLEECQALVDAEYEWEVSPFYNLKGKVREDSLSHRTFKIADVSVMSEHNPQILKEIITKYETGDHCWRHKDSSWPKVRLGWRAFEVWITPLNTGYEGGELYFNDALVEQEVGIPIKRDYQEPHEITKVTKGTRYSLVSWVFCPITKQ